MFAHHQPSAPDLTKRQLRKYAGPFRFYNVTIKAMEFQPSNFFTSLVFSIILWVAADDTMKPLNCMSVSFQRIWRTKNLTSNVSVVKQLVLGGCLRP